MGIGITWNITSLRTNYFKGEELFKEAESEKLLYSQYEQAMRADLTASQVKIFQQSEQLQKNQARGKPIAGCLQHVSGAIQEWSYHTQ